MKMIYVGSLATAPDRDSGWIRELSSLGWNVISFRSDCETGANGFFGKIRRRLHIGAANSHMQRALLDLVAKEKPASVHFRLPIAFDRKTILEIKSLGPVVTEYFNDDLFSSQAPFAFYWKMKKSLTAFDGNFVYRAHNISRYKMAGAAHVEHCAPTYDPARHFLGQRMRGDQFIADAAFIGHCENDWRVECLDAMYRSGLNVIIKGGMWDKAIKNKAVATLAPIKHAFGEEYNHIYSNVIAGLCFFSKINNDTWTERALEIVAVGGVLVCERTPEAATYFTDREEAFFFSTIEELIDIVNLLKSDSILRSRVQLAGHARLMRSGQTIRDRALLVTKFIQSRIVPS